MLFSELAEAELPAGLVPSVDHLLDLKMNGPEKMKIPPIREINRYLDESMEELAAVMTQLPEDAYRDWSLLNQFFLDEITGVTASAGPDN